MQGIPTTYREIRFRSRLEATWARFFDRLGWRWQYEPFDLPGWIPDFVIHGAVDILVEVKPIGSFNEAVAAKMQRAAGEHGWRDELLLVGTGPLVSETPRIGWLGQYCSDTTTPQWYFGHAKFVIAEAKNRRIGFCHTLFETSDRITGCHEGRHSATTEQVARQVWSAWAWAKNKTQWSAA